MPDWLSKWLDNPQGVYLSVAVGLLVFWLAWTWWFNRRTRAVRISADAVKARWQAGEPLTVIDVPKQTAWQIRDGRIGEGVPIDLQTLRPDVLGPADQLTVVY
jgi:hypothetical protein